MDIRKLRYILALHEEGSFIKAAERVHLSQSALSRSVQALEADLGVVLFDRTRDGVVATAAGRQFVARARHAVQVLGDLQHDMRALGEGVAGKLSFGIGPFPAAAFLGAALEQVATQCPRLQVSVEINNAPILVEHLKSERIEFFVADARTLAEDRELAVAPFGAQDGIIACRAGHPLARARDAGLDELARYGFASVHLPGAAYLPPGLAAAFGGDGGWGPQMLACDNLEILKRVVLHSDLLLLATRAVVRRELACGELVAVPMAGMLGIGVAMSVATLRQRSLSPAAQAVIARLREASAAASQEAA
ncbi:MAG TPA: LysR family transcriptional regulator [Burkholderiaceae bacterium]|nr:LysR family transcriptional regulator [Burkholderiaceae bacterium]